MKWISVKDGLPKHGQIVLVNLGHLYIISAKFADKEQSGYLDRHSGEPKCMWWRNNDGTAFTVSCNPIHWMPLPEPPEESF